LWRRAYRADVVGLYFVLLGAWGFLSAFSDLGLAAGALGAAKTLGAGAVALMILGALAYTSARTTLYVITTRRIVFKVGIALPIFYNVPFAQIASASLRLHDDGTGDVPVALIDGQRIAYLTLWPSARPFRFSRPEPALRCVANAREIAETLAGALAEASGKVQPGRSTATPSREQPAHAAAAAA
jgi:hypothetical protein